MIYEKYFWQFVNERMTAYYRRMFGCALVSFDPIIREHRFTNCYRILDRVSQALVTRQGAWQIELEQKDTVYCTLLFRLLNNVQTFERLENEFGTSLFSWDIGRHFAFLHYLKECGVTVYGSAYMMVNSLDTTQAALRELVDNAWWVGHMNAGWLYRNVLEVNGIGKFTAYQLLLDLEYLGYYWPIDDFVVAGPGAKRGIKKCFGSVNESECMTRVWRDQFDKTFLRAPGDLPLALSDIENLFCEIDKYLRVAEPGLTSDRIKIKKRYKPAKSPVGLPAYPEHWNIDHGIIQASADNTFRQLGLLQ